MKKYSLMAAVACGLMLSACGGGNEFKVSGSVAQGADSVKMVLEKSSNGQWLILDSVKTSGEGDFSTALPAPANPDIYRLRYGRDAIYFPIDSLEHIVINTSVSAFASDFTLAGSPDAVTMMNIDKRALQISALRGDERTQAIDQWKRQLVDTILVKPSGIVAYYIINKYIGSTPLFDATNRDDLRIIGAVANNYYSLRPNDPRTDYLVNLLKSGRRYHNLGPASTDTLQVSETALFDISLQDNEGIEQSLTELAAQGNVVLLSFTVYGAEFSTAYNAALNEVYERYKSRGLAIYQLAYDADEFQWRQSAVNLPWITVYDPQGPQSRILSTYNVDQLPLTYIIDRNGEIAERVADPSQLQTAVARHI